LGTRKYGVEAKKVTRASQNKREKRSKGEERGIVRQLKEGVQETGDESKKGAIKGSFPLSWLNRTRDQFKRQH